MGVLLVEAPLGNGDLRGTGETNQRQEEGKDTITSYNECPEDGELVLKTMPDQLDEDRRALRTLFWCSNGPEWRENTGWLEKDNEPDLRKWCGVGVKNGQVTLVDLRRKGLAGAIPPELGVLSGLRYLYLGDNNLQGSIPEEIGQLSNICVLSLSGNNLKGEIDPALGELFALETLSLRDNDLSGEIPPELGQLSLLKHLFLGNNHLRGGIPSELGRMGELRQLCLGDNNLEGNIPIGLTELTQLEDLVLCGNMLSGEIPSGLSILSQLSRLELDGNQLTGRIPPELGELSGLRLLFLDHNNLSGPIPPELGCLGWVQRFDISHNRLSGDIPPEIGELYSVEILQMDHNMLTGSIPLEFGQLQNVVMLSLDNNRLSEPTPPVAGVALNQWMSLKRRAYLRDSDVVGRLSFLEHDNTTLRKENAVLHKTVEDLKHALARVSPGRSISTGLTGIGMSDLAALTGITSTSTGSSMPPITNMPPDVTPEKRQSMKILGIGLGLGLGTETGGVVTTAVSEPIPPPPLTSAVALTPGPPVGADLAPATAAGRAKAHAAATAARKHHSELVEGVNKPLSLLEKLRREHLDGVKRPPLGGAGAGTGAGAVAGAGAGTGAGAGAGGIREFASEVASGEVPVDHWWGVDDIVEGGKWLEDVVGIADGAVGMSMAVHPNKHGQQTNRVSLALEGNMGKSESRGSCDKLSVSEHYMPDGDGGRGRFNGMGKVNGGGEHGVAKPPNRALSEGEGTEWKMGESHRSERTRSGFSWTAQLFGEKDSMDNRDGGDRDDISGSVSTGKENGGDGSGSISSNGSRGGLSWALSAMRGGKSSASAPAPPDTESTPENGGISDIVMGLFLLNNNPSPQAKKDSRDSDGSSLGSFTDEATPGPFNRDQVDREDVSSSGNLSTFSYQTEG
ncbi:unnamed protein product [Discosporangium mesarthrocarpum]